MHTKNLFRFILCKQRVVLNTRNYYQTKLCNLIVNSRKCVFTSNNKLPVLYTPLRLISNEYNENTLLEIDDNEVISNDLIIFNSHKNFVKEKFNVEKKFKQKQIFKNDKPLPVVLKYLNSPPNEKDLTVEDVDSNTELVNLVNFPYSVSVHANKKITNAEEVSEASEKEPSVQKQEWSGSDYIPEFPGSSHGRKWMNDYEKYTDENEETEQLEQWQLDYGTANPRVPISKVPCGGCGALLHCQDPAIPGYLPSEIFLKCSNKDLLSITCQRCHFLKHYNTALAVSVDQDLYPKLLAKIKDERALVVLMVDLTDFPCSIWPGILDIIGKKRPLFVVGNKVDLLWGDHKSWLDHVMKVLRSSFPFDASIKHVSLISAKTGFGIEELINKLHNIWRYEGDVYLIGCTNVGKSTLFNALLQSDYCKVKAVDLLQRATTSPWPGTTLNLLKFPILRPEGWRLYLRTMRLISDRKKADYEKRLRKELMSLNKKKAITSPQLIGHIGRTFSRRPSDQEIESHNNFTIPNAIQMDTAVVQGSGLDPNDPDFIKSKWFYDTPGVLHTDQILDLLTTEELMFTLPKKTIRPRTFLIKPNWTVFIAGLARLDYCEGNAPIRLTIFSSSSLPITVCKQIDADQLYNELLGTEFLLVPQGSQERLKQWPCLKMSQKLSLIGTNNMMSCADIVLSSAGWISVTASAKQICKFSAWTPLGRGVHIRIPSLLPNAVNLRGKKIRRTPTYGNSKPFLD